MAGAGGGRTMTQPIAPIVVQASERAWRVAHLVQPMPHEQQLEALQRIVLLTMKGVAASRVRRETDTVVQQRAKGRGPLRLVQGNGAGRA